MDVIFARLSLAALARVPTIYEFGAIHSAPIPNDTSEVFPSHTLSLHIDTNGKTREELFRRYMQTPAYARKLIFALQQHQSTPQVKTFIARLVEDHVVVAIDISYKKKAVPPKKKDVEIEATVYRNGIFDPSQYLRDRHHSMDEVMFNTFVINYLSGEYDGIFRS